jgi:hypothetical protein
MSTLYRDKLIEITDHKVVFLHYYFPFGGARHVPFTQIAGIEARQPGLLNGSWRLWGTGNFRTWYPRDNRRPSRDRIFVVSLRGCARRIGFTVEDSNKETDILKGRKLLHETEAQ